MSAVAAPTGPKPDPQDLLIEAAREALDREDARLERLDAKARGQMTLAGSWFAVVQAVAAVALRNGMPSGWLIAVGVGALAAATALIIAMAQSAKVWKLKTRPAIGTSTIDAMKAAVTDADFKDKVVQQYQHLLGKAQIANYERAQALDKSARAWWVALALGLVELAIALLARILHG